MLFWKVWKHWINNGNGNNRSWNISKDDVNILPTLGIDITVQATSNTTAY